MRSRTTLATIDAAAMEAIWASPLTIVSTGQGSFGGSLPSTRAMSGVQGRAASARHMAASDACRMLTASISPCGTEATPTSALARIFSNKASRCSRLRTFEFGESVRHPFQVEHDSRRDHRPGERSASHLVDSRNDPKALSQERPLPLEAKGLSGWLANASGYTNRVHRKPAQRDPVSLSWI